MYFCNRNMADSIPLYDFVNKSFIVTQPCLFVHMSSMAAVGLLWGTESFQHTPCGSESPRFICFCPLSLICNKKSFIFKDMSVCGAEMTDVLHLSKALTWILVSWRPGGKVPGSSREVGNNYTGAFST